MRKVVPYTSFQDTMVQFKRQVEKSARQMAKDFPEGFADAQEIWDTFKPHFSYADDPKGFEWFQSYAGIFQDNIHGQPGMGDCDCFSGITAAACAISGLPFEVILCGRSLEYPVHIFCKVQGETLDFVQDKMGKTRYYPHTQTIPGYSFTNNIRNMKLGLSEDDEDQPPNVFWSMNEGYNLSNNAALADGNYSLAEGLAASIPANADMDNYIFVPGEGTGGKGRFVHIAAFDNVPDAQFNAFLDKVERFQPPGMGEDGTMARKAKPWKDQKKQARADKKVARVAVVNSRAAKGAAKAAAIEGGYYPGGAGKKALEGVLDIGKGIVGRVTGNIAVDSGGGGGGEPPPPPEPFWDKNKKWLLPVMIVGGSGILLGVTVAIVKSSSPKKKAA